MIMKFVATVVLALLASSAAFAEEAKPTEESIKQLFRAMHSSKLIDTYMTQIEGTVRASMQQALAGRQPNPQQQEIVDELGKKILSLVKVEVNWANLEPMMVELYRNAFTQREVDGMLAFYRSEVGQAAVSKLPGVTQQAMERMQARLRALTPKIVQLQRDAAAQVKAAGEVPPAPQPTSPAPAARPPKSPPP
jgi:uncharacterized protein